MSRALPPVGWHSTVEQPAQMTTVWACEKTVVMVKQPGHLTSMKKERGAGTSVCRGGEVSQCCEISQATRYIGDGFCDGASSLVRCMAKIFAMSERTYLELVLASLRRRRRVQKIDCENLFDRASAFAPIVSSSTAGHRK